MRRLRWELDSMSTTTGDSPPCALCTVVAHPMSSSPKEEEPYSTSLVFFPAAPHGACQWAGKSTGLPEGRNDCIWTLMGTSEQAMNPKNCAHTTKRDVNSHVALIFGQSPK